MQNTWEMKGLTKQRWKKYFSFCHPGIIVQYFLLLSRNFEWGLCTYILNNLMISVLLKRYYSKMSIKSWFCIFLLDYRWNITCFFYVLEIFSAKFWFWKYFLSSRMTGFTTFSTSALQSSPPSPRIIQNDILAYSPLPPHFIA